MSRPFIPAANCASVELIYSLHTVTVENVLHVQKGSPYSGANLSALRAIIDGWDNTNWKTARTNDSVLTRIRCKALDTASSPIEDYTLPAPRAGTVGSNAMAGNVTWCVKLATGLSGRSFRGRLYMPGISANQVTGGTNDVVAASATFFVSQLNALLPLLTAGGHTLGVLSYSADKAWRAAGLFTAATGFVQVDLHLDSQRRRLTGRGI